MVTMMRVSEISFTVCVFGRSTSMPDCRMGAVIMKMTSKTSMTSTKGTILMSARDVPVWRASWGIGLSLFRAALQVLFLDQRRDFQGEIVHARADLPDFVHKMIVGDHCGNRGKQPRRGGDQRFRDAGSDDAETRRPRRP